MACWNCGAAPTNRDAAADALLTFTFPFTDFIGLLATNNTPSDLELALTRDAFDNDSVRINDLNAQIDVLSATLTRLVAERDGMADRLRKYTTVMAPVRRLPPELVCEIFSWTLSQTKSSDDGPPDQPPWSLGHICQTWRDIAIHFPLLWRTVSISHFEDRRHQPLAMLQTQLRRSADALLDVHLAWWTDEFDDALPVLDVLLPHSNRWNSLRLSCEGILQDSLLDLLYPAKGQLAQLRRLEFNVDAYDNPRAHADDLGSDVFSIAPQSSSYLRISINIPRDSSFLASKSPTTAYFSQR
ncbi:hypothetical protein DFH06DRAFT_1308685, partial [Mycena polygramma]